MKTILNIKLLLLLSAAIITGIVSCEKDDDDVPGSSGKTELLSFGPTGSKPGDTVKFVGYNLNKVTEIQFTGTGAVVPASAFFSVTNEQLFLKLPASTERGYVTLKSPTGDIVSKTVFDMNAPVTITSVTPEARPGANITIKGNLLNWVKSVTFEKNIPPVTTFVSQKIDELVVKVPDNAETGKLVLNTGGTDPLVIETTNALIVTLPKATGFAPNPVKHQTNLTITGTDLDLVKKITFTSVSAAVTSFVSQSATQIVVKVPSETTKGKVTLYPASNVPSVSAADLDVALPAVTTMLPAAADIGDNLTFTGTNLDLVKSVLFQGASTAVTSFVSQSATQLVVKIPTGAIDGKLTLGVINTSLTVLTATALDIISYIPPSGPSFPFYSDAITSNWNGWIGGGWGGTVDLKNAAPVRNGTYSAKIDYVSGAYGVPLQLGGANITLGAYTTFRVSIYGGPGSAGKSVNIGFNEADGKTVTVQEGKWVDFDIPLSQISAATKLTHLYLKNYSSSGAFTIYIDEMGLN